MSEEKIYLYPVWIRIWHMINALMCLLLIITGISMQFSNPKYPLINFNVARSIHNVMGILLLANYVIFLTGNIFTRNGRYYKIPLKNTFRDLMEQFRYYTAGIFRKQEPPFPISFDRKFNPLQQFTYVIVMYLFIPLIFITGIALLYPEMIPNTIFSYNALHLNDLIHIISGFLISVFMVVHIYFCTIGKTPVSNFRSMITGFHESH